MSKRKTELTQAVRDALLPLLLSLTLNLSIRVAFSEMVTVSDSRSLT